MEQRSKNIINHFSKIEDPRLNNKNKLHKLSDILLLVLIGVICGADSWVEIEAFGKARIDFLKGFLDLENGIPSHDTFGDVFSRLNPQAFQESFFSWIQSLVKISKGRMIAIDGKTLRGSRDTKKNAIHMVSAWCQANELVLGQYKVDEKSNEITAIPELLSTLDITHAVVTIDTMGCQRAIATQIITQEGDYVFGLKGNQGNLHKKVATCFAYAEGKNYNDIVSQHCKTIEKDHGRIETREYHVLPLMYAPLFKLKWKGLQSLIKVISHREVVGEKSYLETRYYISSLKPEAERIAHAIRGHWSIENQLHWCLDVAFDEDRCRIRKNNSAENLAVIRHYALNLLKKEKTARVGIKIKRSMAGWSNEYLAKLLEGGQF